MVARQISSLSGTPMGKSLPRCLLVHVDSPGVIPSDYMDFDFSDVFGPTPVLASTEENLVNSGNSEPLLNSREVVYSDPLVVQSRSHSLVGPMNCVPKSLQFSKLTLHETENSLELIGRIDGETLRGIDEISAVDVIETPSDDVKPELNESPAIGLEDFEIMKVVGQGAFGRVFQVKKKSTSEVYAMKVMRKDKIMEKNHAEYMRAERDILTKIDHPFIVKLRYSFQTKYRLYLVLDFINGGHLFFQLYHRGLFREDLARIYTAEIVLAISHLHANGIMHRDLKPENILLDADGHAMLTDFGLAKQFEENTRSNSVCGTVEYMSPEIVLGKGHDKASDWWSVGVLLFEMLSGKPPFVGGNREKIQKKIVKDKIKLPAFLSSEAHSLLKGLLQKDASKHLGSGQDGSEDIKRHKWFKSISWKKLEAREIQPSFCPNVAGKHCIANFEEHWTSMPLSDSPAASPKPSDGFFRGFTYVRPASCLQNASSFN